MATITIHAFRRGGDRPAEIATVDDGDMDEANRVAAQLMTRDMPGGPTRTLQVWLGGRDPGAGEPDLEIPESGDLASPLDPAGP